MKKKNMILRTLLLVVFLGGSPLMAEDRILFKFDNAEAAKVATWRGRVFPNEKFDPSNVTGMGIQLSDKKAGPFKLEVEWIKASQLPLQTSNPDSK